MVTLPSVVTEVVTLDDVAVAVAVGDDCDDVAVAVGDDCGDVDDVSLGGVVDGQLGNL